METRIVVRAEALTKDFGSEVRALTGVSLRIVAGSIYALLGPNGAGKTTTVSILAGMMEPTGGSARVLDLDPRTEGRKLRRKMGIIFQETVLDEELTGGEALEFHGKLYGMKGRSLQAKAREMLEAVQMAEAATRRIKTYSGGMKRRLEIARTFLTEPEVAFIDEPTLGVDPQNRSRIWRAIDEQRTRTGLTILLTTHAMEEAEQVADTVGIMEAGRIVAEGAPAELVRRHGTERISVRTPDAAAVDYASLAACAGGGAAVMRGDRIDIPVAEASSRVAAVARFFEAGGHHIESIDIKRPSLGEVFLSVTGHELRD